MNCQSWKSAALLLSFIYQYVNIHLELLPLTPEESEENVVDDNGSKPSSSSQQTTKSQKLKEETIIM